MLKQIIDLLATIKSGYFCLVRRSFSHDVTAAKFVYKTNPVGIEIFSHAKTFFYSKQFAKLLTT